MGGAASKVIEDAIDNESKELNLEEAKLSSVPNVVFDKLANITTLNLNKNSLSKISAKIGTLGELEVLCLNANVLGSLPDELSGCSKLHTLRLQSNKFSTIPPVVFQLRALSELDFFKNRICNIPVEISLLRKLRRFVVQGNNVSALPDEIGQCLELRYLICADNSLTVLPRTVTALYNVKVLNVSGNDLSALPEDLGAMRALVTLDVTKNKLTALPDLSRLTLLEELLCGENELASLPSSIGRCALKRLNCSKNQLVAIPHEIGNCQQLSCILAQDNKLTSIPSSIQNLASLSILNVSNNQLSEIPSGVGMLRALVELDVTNNPIRDDPLRKLTIKIKKKKESGRKTFDRDRNSQIVTETLEYLQKRRAGEVPAAIAIQKRVRSWLKRRRELNVEHTRLALQHQEKSLNEHRRIIMEKAAAMRIQAFVRHHWAMRRWKFLCDYARARRGTFKVHDYAVDYRALTSAEEAVAPPDSASNILYTPRGEQSVARTSIRDDLSRIAGGTISKLVDKLIETYTPEYVDVFLLTYRTFMTPASLLGTLSKKFFEAPQKKFDRLPVAKEVIDASAEVRSLVTALVSLDKIAQDIAFSDEAQRQSTVATTYSLRSQHGVIFVLKAWLRGHIYDFDSNYMRKRLVAFLNECTWRKSAEELQDLLAVARAERENAAIGFAAVAAAAPTPYLPPTSVSDINFMLLHPVEVARQLTLREHALLLRIAPCEFINQAWSKRNKEIKAPNILALIDFFNHVAGWVATTIVSGETPESRAEIIGRFIVVAQHCRELRNFNAVMEILSGLHNASVSRLKASWAKVLPIQVEMLEKMSTEMSMKGNFKSYRGMLDTIERPCVPYIGMYLSDLTFLDDGNPNTLRDGQLINFEKLSMTSKIVFKITAVTGVYYQLLPIITIQTFISTATNMSERALHAMSLEREPRAVEENVAAPSEPSRFRSTTTLRRAPH